ncbi:MAG: terminase small subunit [Bacteroidales bacterium]
MKTDITLKKKKNYWDDLANKVEEREKKVGRPKTFKNAAQLFKLACEYFKRVDENPYHKEDFIKGGEMAGDIVKLKIMRPYTWEGLEAYLFEKGYISTLKDYQSNREGRYEEFVPIIRAITKIMYDQKFSGASVGVFNANIIARDLGLVDKSNVTVTKEQPLFGDEESK